MRNRKPSFRKAYTPLKGYTGDKGLAGLDKLRNWLRDAASIQGQIAQLASTQFALGLRGLPDGSQPSV